LLWFAREDDAEEKMRGQEAIIYPSSRRARKQARSNLAGGRNQINAIAPPNLAIAHSSFLHLENRTKELVLESADRKADPSRCTLWWAWLLRFALVNRLGWKVRNTNDVMAKL
jgi:hypothetical protein